MRQCHPEEARAVRVEEMAGWAVMAGVEDEEVAQAVGMAGKAGMVAVKEMGELVRVGAHTP